MSNIFRQFFNCLVSAANFTNENHKTLRHVSIRKVGGSHEICGTDGMVLALYTIKDDVDYTINGYIDSRLIKFNKKSKFQSAKITEADGLLGLMVELTKGRDRECLQLPIIQTDVNYPDYAQIIKLDGLYNTNKDSKYGEFLIYPKDMLMVLNSINSKHVNTVGLKPTESPPFETSKENGIECGVYFDPYGDRNNLSRIGTLNINTTTRSREYPEIKSPQYFDPQLLSLVFNESNSMCGSYVTMYLNSELKPAHIKGFSGHAFIESEYLIMPIKINQKI